MNVSSSSIDYGSGDSSAAILEDRKDIVAIFGSSDGQSPTRRSTREAKRQGQGTADLGGSESPPTRGSARHSSRLSSTTQSSSYHREEKEAKKVVTVKPSIAPVTELGDSYPDWSVLEQELEAAKTLDNAYFLDASFLHALTLMELWLGLEGPFFMPRREFRHRHCIFSLFWQPSAPNHAKSQYIVPKKLDGLLRWYLTRDNFIKYVTSPSSRCSTSPFLSPSPFFRRLSLRTVTSSTPPGFTFAPKPITSARPPIWSIAEGPPSLQAWRAFDCLSRLAPDPLPAILPSPLLRLDTHTNALITGAIGGCIWQPHASVCRCVSQAGACRAGTLFSVTLRPPPSSSVPMAHAMLRITKNQSRPCWCSEQHETARLKRALSNAPLPPSYGAYSLPATPRHDRPLGHPLFHSLTSNPPLPTLH